jgi:hypothetical protein
MQTLLHPRQRQILGHLSHQAFLKLTHDGAVAGLDEAEWRHAEVEKLTGRRGITRCDQSHYATLKRHFLDLLGRVSAALAQAQREVGVGGEGNVERQALWRLDQLLQRHGKALPYALPLLRAMRHKDDFTRATVKDIDAVYFTLQDRLERGGRRRKAWQRRQPGQTAAAPAPSTGHGPAKTYYLKAA